ncbi:MAG: hypothetical protein LBL99_01890 [Holosporaceae bacterium]|jgi:hypothetical protein|nr:hypothetical protein [Holosporaceae bacterium]
MKLCEDALFDLDFAKVKRLKFADFTFKNSVELNFANLGELEEIQIYGCKNFTIVGEFPASLKKAIFLNNATSPFSISLGNCPNLEELAVSREAAKFLPSPSSSRPQAEGSTRFLNVLAVWILRCAQDDGKGRRTKFFLTQPMQ